MGMTAGIFKEKLACLSVSYCKKPTLSTLNIVRNRQFYTLFPNTALSLSMLFILDRAS